MSPPTVSSLSFAKSLMPKATKASATATKGKVGKGKATKEKKGGKKDKDPNAPKRCALRTPLAAPLAASCWRVPSRP